MISLFLLVAGLAFGPAVVVASPALVPLGAAAGFFWFQVEAAPVEVMAEEALPAPIEAEVPPTAP